MTPMRRKFPPLVSQALRGRLALPGRRSLAAALAVAALSAPATAPADMPAARFPVLDLDLPLPPRFEAYAAARPVAEQGQVVYRHRSAVGRLADEDLEQALGSLAPGTRIRIGSPRGDVAVTGTYLGLGLSGVRLETVRGPVAYDRAAVRRLWVGRPQAGTGAVIGAVNGFVLGMLLGAVSLETGGPEPLAPDHGGFAPPPGRSDLEQFGQLCFRWGLPVGLAGAALGAVIGSFTTGWQPATP